MPIPNCEYCHCHTNGDRIFLSYAVVFGFLIPVLVNVIAANAEGTNEPLLEKHGINMWFFLVGIGGYCAALNADIKSRIHQANSSVAAADTNTPIHQTNSFNICSLIAVVFGLLSTISLVSILVPRVIGYVILGIAWIFAAVFIAVYEDGRLIMDPGRLIYNKFIKPVFTKTRNWFNEATTSFPCCPSIKQHQMLSLHLSFNLKSLSSLKVNVLHFNYRSHLINQTN